MTEPGSTRTIKVDALARVEGEGGLYVRMRGQRVEAVRFNVFEPPRFFEALLRGRAFSDAPDITSRICGICPVAYILSASQAMEDALAVEVSGPLRDLRRLLYCGEWIQSHVLHTAMLHAPDFLGFQDAFSMAREHPGVVERALALKRLGNQIMELIGGRAVHPVNTRVGGFYRAPTPEELAPLEQPLQQGMEAARENLRFFAGLDFPELEQDTLSVSLHHPDEYAIQAGRIVSSEGLIIAPQAFLEHFEEHHVAHSNALQAQTREGRPYLVGPLARYNNNYAQLSPLARAAAAEAGLGRRCNNPFKSLLVRGVETLYACEEALRLLRNYRRPTQSAAAITPAAGIGHGCTEAPRGLCYHRYELDAEAQIVSANIIPPTSQNQRQMEQDLRGVVERNADMPEAELQWLCEQTLRNYDPCISCATHFLKLDLDRQ